MLTNKGNILKVFLVVVIFLLIFLILAFSTNNQYQDNSAVLSVSDTSTEYGFNTHTIPTSYTTLDIDDFKANIDLMAANYQTWVRFDFTSIAQVEHPNTNLDITWDEANLQIYDQATNYANQKGIKVFGTFYIPLGNPDPTPVSLSASQLTTISQDYFTVLANRFGTKLDLWQVFDESDCYDYNNPASFAVLSPQYLSDLNTIIAASRTTIRNIIPGALVTTNTCGDAFNQTYKDRVTAYFDALTANLDVVSLDAYPNNTNVVSMSDSSTGLGNFISTLRTRYSKPVVIAELGVCTSASNQSDIDLGFTEQGQNDMLASVINSVKSSHPSVLAIYEIQDVESNPVCGFGVLNFDRTAKPSFNTLASLMQNECTSYSFGDWEECQNGVQSRSVTVSYPLGCTLGTALPVTSRSCNISCSAYSYTDWSTCVNGIQTRNVVASFPAGCNNGILTPPVISRSCTQSCASYTYSDWSSCVNGTQSRTVTSSFPIGCNNTSANPPVVNQPCSLGCNSYGYSAWSACKAGVKTRTVTISYPVGCNTTNYSPVTTVECSDVVCSTSKFSDWGPCLNGIQSRTLDYKVPENCDVSNEPTEQFCANVQVSDSSTSNSSTSTWIKSILTGAAVIVAGSTITVGVYYYLKFLKPKKIGKDLDGK